jgi:hypothetical protein
LEKALRARPEFASKKHALVGALLACPALDAFLPASDATRSQALVTETEAKTRARYAEIRAHAQRIGDAKARAERDENDFGDVARVAGLRYLFEGRGLDLSNYSSNFAPGRDTFGWGFNEFGGDNGGLRNALCRFLPELMTEDPTLAPLAAIRGYGYGSSEETQHCDLLRSRSLLRNTAR